MKYPAPADFGFIDITIDLCDKSSHEALKNRFLSVS
jgi:hypothetical protein